MTAVDRPDNGQDEARDLAARFAGLNLSVPLYPLSRRCCGAPDSDTCHQRGLCWMEGVHPDSPGFASGRAGAGEQQRELARQWQGLASSADIVRNVAGTDYARGHMSGAASALRRCADELLALLGGPQPDGEAGRG